MNDQELLKRLLAFSKLLTTCKDRLSIVDKSFGELHDLGNADGASWYFRDEEDQLELFTFRNDSLGIQQGGTTGEAVTIPKFRLFDDNGEPNYEQLVSFVTHTGETVNIDDVYDCSEFNFSGSIRFDEKTGYRTKSVVTIPLKDISDEVFGVVQILNAIDPDSGEVVSFPSDIVEVLKAITSHAALALERQMMFDRQQALLSNAETNDRQKVFLSHSSRNRELLERELLPIMDELDVEYWYSRVSIQSAIEWERSILAGLEQCDSFLLIMTPEALQSQWVKDELFWAIDNRPDKIIPVLMSPCNPADFHIRMRRIQVIDYVGEPDRARQGLKELLRPPKVKRANN